MLPCKGNADGLPPESEVGLESNQTLARLPIATCPSPRLPIATLPSPRLPIATRPSPLLSMGLPLDHIPPDPRCVRGFRHEGHGGRCGFRVAEKAMNSLRHVEEVV